jgi:protein Tex
MTITDRIAQQLGIATNSVAACTKLLADGATVPFIARYRKEATNGLDELQITDIKQLIQKFDELIKRKEYIIEAIKEQDKLNPQLLSKIQNCWDAPQLEDLFLPYKPKRKTRASVAIELGLEPLARLIYEQKTTGIEAIAQKYLTKNVANTKTAIAGAADIMAEWIAEDDRIRAALRRVFEQTATIYAKVKKGKEAEAQKYLDYFAFEEALAKIPSHRMLALRRGQAEGYLALSISPNETKAINALEYILLKGLPEPKKIVENTIADAYKRLLHPSLENEFLQISKEKADHEAIRIFEENLRQLLLSAPLGPKNLLALDPGFRTGCKLVVLNRQGNLQHHSVIYPHNGNAEQLKAAETLNSLIAKHSIEAIAIGNGTAGRETESFVKQYIASSIPVFMISEQGASIYSASAVAREEFPQHDVTVRGAVSIGRRLIDPLAELVKIDPKSIGVGQYQHDVDQRQLKNRLDEVVVSCVNKVGVNLNTASKHILAYVSGLGPVLAQNIIDYRSQNGAFGSRNQLKNVPRLGNKAFEQSAGFLRIPNASNPLDSTAVHPESYPIVQNMAANLGCNIADLLHNASLRSSINPAQYTNQQAGLHTLKDILAELAKPGLDPRQQAEAFQFDPSVRTLADLSPNQWYPGIVTNITAFGAFVDIGVKQDGLLHLSQMANTYITDPNQVVKLHQQLQVRVTEVDPHRKRISLSLKKQ